MLDWKISLILLLSRQVFHLGRNQKYNNLIGAHP